MNNYDSTYRERDLPMDILRTIACFMVINQHVVSDGIYGSWSDEKTVLAVIDCVSVIAVPLFLMMSGAFSNNVKISKALKKAIYLFALFVFFKLFYNLTDCLLFEDRISWDSLYYSHHITDLTSYKDHLWFLPEFIVVILISPVLNLASKHNPKISGYLAIIFIVYGIILPSTFPIRIWGDMKVNIVGALLEALPLNFPMGIGYYCLGKAIFQGAKNVGVFKKNAMKIAVVAGLLWVITNVIVSVKTINGSKLNDLFDCSLLDRTGLPVFLAAVLFFFIFALFSLRSEWLRRFLDIIVPNILFIYLIHPIFIDLLTYKFGFVSLSFNPALSAPLKVCLVFILSFIVSLPITKILKLVGRKTDKQT